MWKSRVKYVWIAYGILRAPPMAWHSVGYTVMLQDYDDAVSGLTRTFVLELGLQFLKHLTVAVCTACVVITWFEFWNRGPKMWKNTVNIISTWVSVVREKWSISTTCLPIFLLVVGYGTSHQWPQHATKMHHPPSGTTARVPFILTCSTPLVCQ